jgi:hypothetical protein
MFHRPNIPLSCATRSIDIPEAHIPYIPPHPQQGTPYHRYVLLLLPQKSPTEHIFVSALSDAHRLHFNLREFASQHGLDGSTGGGVHMWRQVWDEGVSQIYTTVLSMFSSPTCSRVLIPFFPQDERSPGSWYHPNWTAMRISAVSDDMSSRLPALQTEQRIYEGCIPR